MIEFVFPEQRHRADVEDFYTEIEQSGGTCIGFACHDDYDKWLIGMQNRKEGKNLPENYVRENFYLCYEDGVLVGVFSLKLELNDYLLSYGGHIGYAVRPSLRNRGIATKMLEKGLKIAKNLGMDSVLCFCDEDNVASEKVIINNGGKLINIVFDPEENVFVKRYRIDL